jgi:regulator of nucleoside diphosphate kinase
MTVATNGGALSLLLKVISPFQLRCRCPAAGARRAMVSAPTSFHGRPLELPTPYLLEVEYEELADLVCRSARGTPGLALLWRELQRAVIIKPDAAPPHRVHLHSRVRYTDLARPRHRTAQIVSPLEPGTGDPALVSVLSLTGAALIGLRQGAVMP